MSKRGRPSWHRLVLFDSQFLGVGTYAVSGSQEEIVLRVEKGGAGSVGDQQKTPLSQSTSPIVLRSTPEFPLLLDPDQRLAVEHFGVLRARLLNARAKSGLHTIVISSPQQQDGKSFTSINLAISLAQLQQLRVLFVDGDMRVRGASRGLELEQDTGLADFLQHCASFEDCVKATTLSHLYIAPAGNVVGEPLPGILQGASWPEFVQTAKQEFDIVIVDSVPVTAPIADFELLLNACDAALLVVRIRKTKREALDFVTNRMQGKLLGVVVNNKEPRPDFGYQPSYDGNRRK